MRCQVGGQQSPLYISQDSSQQSVFKVLLKQSIKMFKLLMFVALLAFATAKPLVYTAPFAAAYTAPFAAAYTAPVAAAYTAPAAYSAYSAYSPLAYSAYSYASPYSYYY